MSNHKIVFVAGLDEKDGYKVSFSKTAEYLKNGYGNSSEILSFRWKESTQKILPVIESDTYVVLFSKSCEKSEEIATYLKSKGWSLDRLLINEAYTASSKTFDKVNAAVKLGVPISNVFAGCKSTKTNKACNSVGGNITGATVLKRRSEGGSLAHYYSLTLIGEILKDVINSGIPLSQAISSRNTKRDETDTEQKKIDDEAKKKQAEKEQKEKADKEKKQKEADKKKGEQEKREKKKKEEEEKKKKQDAEEKKRQEDLERNKESKSDKTNEKNDVNNKADVVPPSQSLKNVFQATIKPLPITIKFEGKNASESELELIKQKLGYDPFVWLKGITISKENIIKFSLFHNEMVPAIKITFNDSWGLMQDDGFPMDDAVISLFLNSRSKNLRSINMDFKIITFKSLGKNKYYLYGLANIPELYIRKFESFKEKTSYDTIKEISKNCELGFSSNVSNSEDKMNWVNPGFRNLMFVQDIITNSYISDKSFQYCYIDYYYNICYVDLNKELFRDVSNEQMIETFSWDLIRKSGEYPEESVIPALLTNDLGLKNSNSFIKSFIIMNKSTKISLSEAYRTRSKYYNTINKELLVFDVDSQTEDGTRSIIFKGNPDDDGSFYRDNLASVWLGKLDPWNEGKGNSHINFNYAEPQNMRNYMDLNKLTCVFVLPNVNMNLYIFQKISLLFQTSKETPATQTFFYKRISGNWLITEIKFNYERGATYQKITAVKRELTLLPDEQIKNIQERNQEINIKTKNDEDNENPLTPEEQKEVEEKKKEVDVNKEKEKVDEQKQKEKEKRENNNEQRKKEIEQIELNQEQASKSVFIQDLVKNAISEWIYWDKGRIKEGDQRTLQRLRDYWQKGAKKLGMSDRQMINDAWSAAFISYVMFISGAGSQFRYTSLHAIYIVACVKNRKQNNDNPFKAYRAEEIKVGIGDIICYPRQSGITYDTTSEYFAHGDFVVDIKDGKAEIIGGNVSSSVTKLSIALTSDGKIDKTKRPGSKYFVVIKSFK